MHTRAHTHTCARRQTHMFMTQTKADTYTQTRNAYHYQEAPSVLPALSAPPLVVSSTSFFPKLLGKMQQTQAQ